MEAQRKGDLAAIQAIVRDLKARDAAALHALMQQLDPDDARAFVSAHVIARNLLLDATRTGETKYVADAAKVVRAHAARRHRGKCAAAMKLYADAVEEKDAEKAAETMERALVVMHAEGWTYLVMHAAVEVAARTGDEKRAVAAIEKVGDLFPAGSDRELCHRFQGLVRNRLAGAPAAVKEACDKVMAPHGPLGAGAPGGAGGPGGPAGGVSKVGRALSRFARTKLLVTIARRDDGFEWREGFDKNYRHLQPYQHGIVHHTDGGVTIGFWGHAVGLAMVDPVGNHGVPGDGPTGPGAFAAFEFLARGETWGFTKSGEVVIK